VHATSVMVLSDPELDHARCVHTRFMLRCCEVMGGNAFRVSRLPRSGPRTRVLPHVDRKVPRTVV